MAGRASIGSLVVSLGLDAGEYFAGIDKADYKAKQMARSLDKGFSAVGRILGAAAVAATAAGAAFLASAQSVLQAGDEAIKASQKFGLTAESYQELAYAGKLADVSTEELGTALKKLNVGMAETQTNTGEAKDAFKALGISVTGASGNLKQTDEVFLEIADKFAKMEDGAGKTALAVRLFGRAGAELIPLLNGGAAGLRENAEEARKFGIIIGSEAAKQMEQFNDNLTRLKEQSKGFATAILTDALPALNRFLEQLIEGTKIAGGFFNALRLFGLSTINLDNAGAKVKEFTEDIEKLQRAQEKQAAAGRKGFEKQVGPQIEDLKKKIEYAKLLQRQSALATPVEDDVLTRRAKNQPKEKAPAIIDTKKAADEAKRAAEAYQRYLDTLSKLSLEATQEDARRRLAILDAERNAQAIGDEEYFRKRAEIAQTALEAEKRVLDEQIARQRALANSKTAGTRDYHEEEAKLAELLAKRNKLEADGKLAVELLGYEQRAAAKNYQRDLAQLNIQLLEMQGNTEAAARARLAIDIGEKRERFRGDAGAQKKIDDMQAAGEAEIAFNAAREAHAKQTEKIQLDEERLALAIRTGAKSRIQVLQMTSEHNRKAADELEAFAQNMDQLAKKPGFEKYQIEADRARLAIERLRAESDLLVEAFNEVFASAGADALTDFFDKTKTAKEAFESFSDSVVKQINRMVAEALAADFANALGLGGKGGGASPGSVFAGLFGGPKQSGQPTSGGNAQGAGGGNLVGQLGGMFTGFLDGLGSFFGFATGTRSVPRDMVAKLHKGERVVSASENVPGGMGNVTQAFYFNAPVDRRSQEQVSAAAGRGVQRALERNT